MWALFAAGRELAALSRGWDPADPGPYLLEGYCRDIQNDGSGPPCWCSRSYFGYRLLGGPRVEAAVDDASEVGCWSGGEHGPPVWLPGAAGGPGRLTGGGLRAAGLSGRYRECDPNDPSACAAEYKYDGLVLETDWRHLVPETWEEDWGFRGVTRSRCRLASDFGEAASWPGWRDCRLVELHFAVDLGWCEGEWPMRTWLRAHLRSPLGSLELMVEHGRGCWAKPWRGPVTPCGGPDDYHIPTLSLRDVGGEVVAWFAGETLWYGKVEPPPSGYLYGPLTS